MMLYEFKSRWTGAVCASVEIDAKWEAEAFGLRLGAAVRAAVVGNIKLRDAVLSGAVLSGADLSGAVLSGAVLRGADLSGADLSGAVLRDADLSDADAVISAGFPNGWTAVAWQREGKIMLRVGCRNFTLAEGREYWAGKPDRREVMAALDYIEAVALIREWPVFGDQANAA
jgi:hypothetical protein